MVALDALGDAWKLSSGGLKTYVLVPIVNTTDCPVAWMVTPGPYDVSRLRPPKTPARKTALLPSTMKEDSEVEPVMVGFCVPVQTRSMPGGGCAWGVGVPGGGGWAPGMGVGVGVPGGGGWAPGVGVGWPGGGG